MLYSKKYLIVLTTALLLSQTSKAAFPFSIKGATTGSSMPSLENPPENYVTDKIRVITPDIELVTPSADFLSTLDNSFDRWNFSVAEQQLTGEFNILYYYPCTPSVNCGSEWINPQPVITPEIDAKGGIGAFFNAIYTPSTNDPQSSDLHWIQRVLIHDINADGSLGVKQEDFIDVSSRNETPYYDTDNYPFAGSDAENNLNFFLDRPYRTSLDIKSMDWSAELYLARGKGKKVTIYNGVKWGWKSTVTPPIQFNQIFYDSLSSGREKDNFYLDGLTPGATFYAWTNNDLASNRCNPNTYLSGYNDDGYFLAADDNSSHLGDGFGSAVWGTVSSNGKINLSVQAAHGGARGEDEGNYELSVNVYDAEDFPLDTDRGDSDNDRIVVGNSGSSGGGGIVMGVPDDGSIIVSGSGGGGIDSTPGRSQEKPIFPDTIDNEGWQTFNNVPGCRWYDPPIAKTFEFVATDNTLFTEILDFPTGEDNLFTVVVEDMVLGEYSPGDRVDFVSLLGRGISNFKITDIDYLVGSTEETYFPFNWHSIKM